MSFKPQVFVDNEWCINGLVFETKAEAEYSAKDLFNRWLLCTDCRAIESDERPNYKIVDGQMLAYS